MTPYLTANGFGVYKNLSNNMLSFFEKKSRLMLILIPIIAGILQIIHFDANEKIKLYAQTGLFFNYNDFYLSNNYTIIVYNILTIIFLSLLTLLFILIINRSKIFEQNTFFHGFIFLFVVESNLNTYIFLPAIIAGIFLILSIHTIFETVNKKSVIFNYFNACILMSFGSLFYTNLIFFLLLIFVSLILLHPYSIKIWFSSIIGIITPYYIVFAIFFVKDGNLDFFFNIIDNFFINRMKDDVLKLSSYLFYSFISFILILATIDIGEKFHILKINIRSYFKVFFLMFIISFIIYIFSLNTGFEILIFVSFSISIPITMFFNKIKNKLVANILFYILLILLVYKIYEL